MDMNYNEWSNYTALGYLRFALNHYNTIAVPNDEDGELRTLTDTETKKIIACMKYSFDAKTLKEAYELG